MQLSLKMLSGMANSVDPDQTAPVEQSDQGLHCLHMPFCQILRFQKFRIFTIVSFYDTDIFFHGLRTLSVFASILAFLINHMTYGHQTWCILNLHLQFA